MVVLAVTFTALVLVVGVASKVDTFSNVELVGLGSGEEDANALNADFAIVRIIRIVVYFSNLPFCGQLAFFWEKVFCSSRLRARLGPFGATLLLTQIHPLESSLYFLLPFWLL